ncbi:MAG: sulfatase-like hydrolase/transferase [Akkermansiaceae bacterium]
MKQKMIIWMSLWACAATALGALGGDKPNIVIFFLDDSGWADFHPFGDPAYATPHVEKLAEEGCRFNKFFVPQAICSASRSALMSGCYPGRTKIFGAHGPNAKGLDPKFATMGEVFQAHGYKTAIFGKWHIGDQPETRPAARGFTESAGLMYSNDMWKHHPVNPKHWGKFPLKYWSNGKVIVEDVTKDFQKSLTERATVRSIDFIKRHKKQPFLLYVPYSMPHVPLFCSDKFKGKSETGIYGDVIMELDDSMGRILAEIKANGLEQNTVVVFSSDNGPWAGYGDHAGKTPFREFKATGFNGGVQSACIIKYPSKIKASSSSDATFCSVDLLPTFCKLTGAGLPAGEIDGRDVWPLIVGKDGAANPHAYYPISTGRNLDAVISGDGRWKLHLPHTYRHVVKPGVDGNDGIYERRKIGLSLFDLKNDSGEEKNLIEKYPELADKLKQLATKHQQKFYK